MLFGGGIQESGAHITTDNLDTMVTNPARKFYFQREVWVTIISNIKSQNIY
jgi:hypothetical protein